MAKYSNPTKDTWRGWIWNRIANHLRPGSTVMVLCGDSAMDLEVGTRKGFEVIGVDIVQECVDTFEQRGGIAVKDKIHHQVLEIKPDAVILDELGGITPRSWGNIGSAMISCKVIAGNWMRGHDKDGAKMANDEFVQSCMKLLPKSNVESARHRGKLMFLHQFFYAWNEIYDKFEEKDMSSNEVMRFLHGYFNSLCPSFFHIQARTVEQQRCGMTAEFG